MNEQSKENESLPTVTVSTSSHYFSVQATDEQVALQDESEKSLVHKYL